MPHRLSQTMAISGKGRIESVAPFFQIEVDAAPAVNRRGSPGRAGGTIVKLAQQAQWDGYFGYFSDLDGCLWKVASSQSRMNEKVV